MSINAPRPVKRRFELLPPRTAERFARIRGQTGFRAIALGNDTQANNTTATNAGQTLPAGSTIVQVRLYVLTTNNAIGCRVVLTEPESDPEVGSEELFDTTSGSTIGIHMITNEIVVPVFKRLTAPKRPALVTRNESGVVNSTTALIQCVDPQPVIQTPLP